MHRAFDVKEARPFAMRYLVAVGLTLVLAVVIVGSFVTIVGGAMLVQQAVANLGLGELATTLLWWLRWPALFLALTGAVAILYRYGPSVAVPWRWVLAGAAVFALGWLVATGLLGFYVGHIADYGATYGSLGAVIVLMTWFYVTAALLMIGAEIAASLARELTPDAIRRRGEEEAVARAVDGAANELREGVEGTTRRITS